MRRFWFGNKIDELLKVWVSNICSRSYLWNDFLDYVGNYFKFEGKLLDENWVLRVVIWK